MSAAETADETAAPFSPLQEAVITIMSMASAIK